jgi:RimJ/RimL family protein N-acetyltransferase
MSSETPMSPPHPRPISARPGWSGTSGGARRERGKVSQSSIPGTARSSGIAVAVRLDEAAGEAELGYILAPEARGRGAATEALRQLTDWGFARGLKRLELRVDGENEASKRVAARCGYTHEGVLRSVYFKEGRRSDLFIYSLLPGDD